MIFVSGDDSSMVFGNKMIDALDNYWYARPPRIRLALVASDTGNALLAAIDSSSSSSSSSSSDNNGSNNNNNSGNSNGNSNNSSSHRHNINSSDTTTTTTTNNNNSGNNNNTTTTTTNNNGNNSNNNNNNNNNNGNSNNNNGNSQPGGLLVSVVHDVGPWNRYLHSASFKAVFVVTAVANSLISLGALAVLLLSFCHGRKWPSAFKVLSLAATIFFMVINIVCQIPLPITNAQNAVMYLTWLVGNVVFSWIIVQWARFMKQLSRKHILPYRILQISLVLNVVFFSAGMVVSVVAIYSRNQRIRLVGVQLYGIIAAALFFVESLCVLYAGVLYMGYLRRTQFFPAMRKLLVRQGASTFLFCAGRFVVAVSMAMHVTHAAYTVALFEVMVVVSHFGVILTFSAVVWLMSLPTISSLSAQYRAALPKLLARQLARSPEASVQSAAVATAPERRAASSSDFLQPPVEMTRSVSSEAGIDSNLLKRAPALGHTRAASAETICDRLNNNAIQAAVI
ncbi:hypothetical protein GQ42DRAFT_93391 [Ramicandelaber brevisporus]|nr:hypothetical protein GQ42DRAFT_93391 [Ramicandelaber brevisporus]